ncbi:MAG: acyl--CoA ligase, partial [Lachnospiraceae bacterium]|nr:acyl--CoA ligase [Lachnospiraceae bacterium]
VGVPMKGVIVATFEPDTCNRLSVGKEGEICIHSDSVFWGYLNNEEETKKIKQMHNDGLAWIHTGDLGYVDKDGYVYITGRAKRLIKREAFKIAPDTIENVIMGLEEVKDCVVVGVPDLEHEGSAVPMAYVEVQTEYKELQEEIKKRILRKCQEELPDYEVPQYIECIDKIPYKNTKHNFKQLEAMGEEYVLKRR